MLLYRVCASEGYFDVCLFEKVGDFPDFMAVVCECVIAVTNKHTAKLHHVGSLYILTYDARNIKHKISKL
jgi:hypothetical protein